MQKNFFVIYIGGSHEGSLIELHDMRFAIADKIENTYDYLKRSWWGTPHSLHLDAWGILNWADGYRIEVRDTPSKREEKLFFVNLGGYQKDQFTELHKNIFVVAKDQHEAKLKAVQNIQNWSSPHRDYLYEIENLVDISHYLVEDQGYLCLYPDPQEKLFKFTVQYVPIGRE